MQSMFLFLIASVGMTIIFTRSSMCSAARNLLSKIHKKVEELVSCSMCAGFWIGLIVAAILNKPLFISAFSVSLLSWITTSLVDCIHQITDYYESKQISLEEGNYEQS